MSTETIRSLIVPGVQLVGMIALRSFTDDVLLTFWIPSTVRGKDRLEQVIMRSRLESA